MAKSLVKRERWSFRDFQKAVQVLKEDWERAMRTLFCSCPVPSCCRLKRNTGWWENVWNTYSDARFKKTNRASQETYSFILNCIAPLLVQQTVTEEPITSALKLAICLYRLGRGDYLYTISEISGLGVFTVSSICLGVCQVLVDHLWNETVSTHMLLDMEEFWQFPCCWAAIDGYHAPMKCPPGGLQACKEYHNLKNFYSIVLMAMADSHHRFVWGSCKFPGNSHDASLFRSTDLWTRIQEGLIPVIGKTICNVTVPPLVVQHVLILELPIISNWLRVLFYQ